MVADAADEEHADDLLVVDVFALAVAPGFAGGGVDAFFERPSKLFHGDSDSADDAGWDGEVRPPELPALGGIPPW